MKILQIRSAFEDNGPGSQSLTIGEELRRRGHDVTYAASGGKLCDKIQRAGFAILQLPGLALDKRDPLNVVRTVLQLRRIFAVHRFDVVHSHNAAATFLAFAASRLTGQRPVMVRSVRGVEVRSTHQWRNLLYRFYPARMLAVSDFTRRELLRLGADPARVTVTYNGVNLARFDPLRVSGEIVREQFGIGDRPLVGHVGAFSGWKGQEVLVRALERLRDRHGALALLFVGDGPARPGVQRLVQELGLADRVHFAGFRTDVEIFHAAFDVYAQPSTRGEMLPNSILESMAMGNPWVGSDLSGLSEMTAGGAAGLLCPPGDVESLARNLERLLDDPGLRDRMGRAARAEVERRFSIARVVDAIEAEYGMAT